MAATSPTRIVVVSSGCNSSTERQPEENASDAMIAAGHTIFGSVTTEALALLNSLFGSVVRLRY
jgi:hypothetical protein